MPPGCRSEPPPPTTEHHVCCAKIVCDGDHSVPQRSESENLLQRSKTTAVEAAERPNKEEGCVYEGVRYGPGSAMMGSRRCEYCYCISGARKCIQPKCLLPLPGCVPLYNPHSCCPVAYNCTRQAEFSTTLAAISAFGCRKGQRVYQEGEMVRDIPWKAACDNCFCAMGAIRCVPLACAPPLQGCQPIVRPGQCCPSTYNCSGTIEVKAEQNFASYAFISKDYAKFRKENHYYPAIHDPALTSIEGRGYRVVNEILAPSSLASGRSSSGGGVGGLSDSATEKFSLANDSSTTESIISSDEDGNNDDDDDAGTEEHDDDDVGDGDGDGGGSSETETMNNEIIGETTDYPKQQQQQSTTTTITTTGGKLELSSEITLDQSVTTTTTTAALAASDNDEQTSNYADAEPNTSPPETTPMPAVVVSTTAASIASPEVSVGGDVISISMLSSENCSSHGQDDFETTLSDRAAAESTSSVSVNVTEAATTTSMPTTSTTAASTTTTTTTTTTKKPSSSGTTPRIKINKKNSTSSARPTKKNNGNGRPSKSTQKPHTKKNTTKRLGSGSKIATKNDNSNNNVIEKSSIVAQVDKSSVTCTNGTTDETTTTDTSTSTSPATTSTSTSTTTTTTTTTTSTTTTTTTESPEVTTLAYEEEAERTTTTSIDRISDDNEPIMERDKINDDNDEGEKTISMISVKNPSSGLSTSILVPNDMLVMNVTVKTNVAVETIYGNNKHQEAGASSSGGGNGNKPSMSPDVQAILNITRRKGDAAGGAGEDYEFDYNEPTLPPSLPNVRIIPFVAADALVKDKDGEVVSSSSSVATGFPAVGVVPELRNDANFYDIVTQTSRFSPPAKTEGGFVPKDQSHFDALFHSSASDLNLEVSTGVTVAPEEMPVPPNPHRKTDVMSNKCLYEELEYTHGQFLPSRALCVRCICYFGQIICSSRKCPPLKIGCKRISDPNNKCCDNVVCADGVESPTVVLDRADSESSSQHEPTVSPDPFRDVIKTEPAPDLSSLIGEMQPPYLMPEPSLTATTTTTTTTTTVATITSSEASPAEDQQQQQQSLSPPPLTSVDDFSRYNDSHDDDDGGNNETDAAASVSITSKSFSADDVTLTTTDPIIKDNEADDSSIFSLDSVFNLFFDDDRPAETWGEKTAAAANVTNSSSIVKVPAPTTTGSTTAATVISSSSTTTTTTPTSTTEPTSPSTSTTEVTFTTLEESSSSEPTTTTTTTTPTTTTTTTKKPATQADNDPLGLLKLAGCNIYGKMYRVNRIIAELSSDCRECRCSEFGVQCKSLDC
ncbi:mucin-5AC-like isoform X2 [Trichogramma pretiosum]|uniref:mucin-5AC-like isoform X2 n=1 Tax=Trichogramma pretiosum TaxID=7493 RepID=UPI0006C9DC06|nr:mucin-5AC-like isoform X2 [Trichogramma pretiosum]